MRSARAEELRDRLQSRLLRDRLRAIVHGQLARVARGDRLDVDLVFRGELLTRHDFASHPAAVHGMAAHETLAVLVLGGAGVLLVRRLQREEDHHRLAAEGGVREETLADGGFGEEGVEVG